MAHNSVAYCDCAMLVAATVKHRCTQTDRCTPSSFTHFVPRACCVLVNCLCCWRERTCRNTSTYAAAQAVLEFVGAV